MCLVYFLNHIKQGFPPKCIKYFAKCFSPCRCWALWLLEAALLSSGYRCPWGIPPAGGGQVRGPWTQERAQGPLHWKAAWASLHLDSLRSWLNTCAV